MGGRSLGLVYLWLINMGVCYRLQDVRSLAVLSEGASCLVGTYGTYYDSGAACLTAMDGARSVYRPQKGPGWLTVSLNSTAVVLALDIVLDWPPEEAADSDQPLRVRVVFSYDFEHVTHVFQPSNTSGLVRQRILYPEPAITKSVTVSWTASQMPPIADVIVVGTTAGIERVVPSNLTCTTSDCARIDDDNMLTYDFLTASTDVHVHFSSPRDVSLMTIYTHPLLNQTKQVAVVIAYVNREEGDHGKSSVLCKGQGWDTEARWQSWKINSIYDSVVADYLTLNFTYDYVTVGEIEFYRLDEELFSLEAMWLGDLPYFELSDAPHVYDQPPVIIGEMPEAPPAQDTTPSLSLESSGPTVQVSSTSNVPDFVTTTPRSPRRVAPDVTTDRFPEPTDVTSTPTTDSDAVQMTSEETASGGIPPDPEVTEDWWPSVPYNRTADSPPYNSTLPGDDPARSLFGITWYWLVFIALGVLCLILMLIIIVVLVARVSKKNNHYAPNPRPQVTLRSISRSSAGGESNNTSVVTPTRGWYQMTINSQSSNPTPYQAFSPYNTSTFGRRDVHPQYGFSFPVPRTSTSAYDDGRRSVTEHYGASNGFQVHDGELSDECFKP